jgi:hypothetical protein
MQNIYIFLAEGGISICLFRRKKNLNCFFFFGGESAAAAYHQTGQQVTEEKGSCMLCYAMLCAHRDRNLLAHRALVCLGPAIGFMQLASCSSSHHATDTEDD